MTIDQLIAELTDLVRSGKVRRDAVVEVKSVSQGVVLDVISVDWRLQSAMSEVVELVAK